MINMATGLKCALAALALLPVAQPVTPAGDGRPVVVHGEITKLEGRHVTIKTRDKETVVTLPEKSLISVDADKATLEDVKVGMKGTISVVPDVRSTDGVRGGVIVYSPNQSGIIESIGDGELTLKPSTDKAAGEPPARKLAEGVRVRSTEGMIDRKDLKLADLHPGDRVVLIPKEGVVTKILVSRPQASDDDMLPRTSTTRTINRAPGTQPAVK